MGQRRRMARSVRVRGLGLGLGLVGVWAGGGAVFPGGSVGLLEVMDGEEGRGCCSVPWL